MTWKHFEYARNLQKRYQNYRRHVALMNKCIVSWSPVPLCGCSLLPAKLRIIYMPHQRANQSLSWLDINWPVCFPRRIVAGILWNRLVCYKSNHTTFTMFWANHSNNYHTLSFRPSLSFLKIYRAISRPLSIGKIWVARGLTFSRLHLKPYNQLKTKVIREHLKFAMYYNS